MSSPKSPSSPKSDASGQQRPPDASTVIEVDTADGQSTYSLSTQVTDTESLRSSIFNYKWENGRRYHAYGEGTYWGPNDDRQQDAEDIMHEVYRIVLDGKLHLAPIGDNPQRVVDIGCGTGIWAIEFADLYPSARTVGVDLSPIQPNFVPPNCEFQVDDVNKEWTFHDDEFDYVHIRYMTGSIPDWHEFLLKAQKHTKPGGWIEYAELWGDARSDDGSLLPDSPLAQWVDIFKEIGEKIGQKFFFHSGKAFRAAGLENVTEHVIKVPVGTWPKDETLKLWGSWNRQFVLQGLEGFALRGMTEILGWSFHEAEVFLANMRKQILDPNVHSYVLVTSVHGQKPKSA